MLERPLRLRILPGLYAVCRLARDQGVPEWANEGAISFIARTEDELSIVCLQECVPEGIIHEPGWRFLKLAGPIELSETGVVASLAGPLAAAAIAIFAVSTYETDYLLVKEQDMERAVEALRARAIRVE